MGGGKALIITVFAMKECADLMGRVFALLFYSKSFGHKVKMYVVHPMYDTQNLILYYTLCGVNPLLIKEFFLILYFTNKSLRL